MRVAVGSKGGSKRPRVGYFSEGKKYSKKYSSLEPFPRGGGGAGRVGLLSRLGRLGSLRGATLVLMLPRRGSGALFSTTEAPGPAPAP